MTQLAIKGHETRGEEVIELLEVLGGKNLERLNGSDIDAIYHISSEGYINASYDKYTISNHKCCKLEEFKEKYPCKVGDKVIAYAEACIGQFTIQDMRWNSELNKVEYKIGSSWLDTSMIQSYKEEKTFPPYMDYDITITNEEAEKIMIKNQEFPQSINLTQSNVDEIEVVLGDYDIVVKDDKTFFVKKKPKYPKTYDECCDILEDVADCSLCCFACELLNNFQKLLLCRDAYWEIACEEMGLDKPWKYDMSKDEFSYAISYQYGRIQKIEIRHKNAILIFPIVEMRDAFYENFKDLIEECKELL